MSRGRPRQAPGARQLAEGEVQLTGWKQPRRVVFARQFQGLVASGKNGEFWDLTKHEFAVYVTDLPETYTCWQIQIMYRERADVENVFDELKNQWGFGGFSAKSRAASELAARLLLVVSNLWGSSCVSSNRKSIPRRNAGGVHGDDVNLLLAATAANLRLWLRRASACPVACFVLLLSAFELRGSLRRQPA